MTQNITGLGHKTGRTPDTESSATKRKTMKKSTEKRTKWLTIRVTEAEFSEVERLSQEAVCRHVSEYTRKMVLGKPVVQHYHNKPLEDFIEEMLALRRTLDGIANNYNQVVLRLHSLRQLSDLREWILINEQDKTQLSRQIETISKTILKIYDLWSRE
jgi:hypothetical protein